MYDTQWHRRYKTRGRRCLTSMAVRDQIHVLQVMTFTHINVLLLYQIFARSYSSLDLLYQKVVSHFNKPTKNRTIWLKSHVRCYYCYLWRYASVFTSKLSSSAQCLQGFDFCVFSSSLRSLRSPCDRFLQL